MTRWQRKRAEAKQAAVCPVNDVRVKRWPPTHNPESLMGAEGERVPKDVPTTSNVPATLPREDVDDKD